MRAGTLHHRITLQQPGGSSDELGERVTTWTDRAIVYANLEPLTGRDQFIASQRHASTTHRITIRYNPVLVQLGLDASWRVKYGARIFTMDGPPRDVGEAGHTLEMYCTEGLREE